LLCGSGHKEIFLFKGLVCGTGTLRRSNAWLQI